MGTRTGPGSRTAAYRLAAGLVVGFASVVIAVLPASVAGAATQSVTNCNDSGVGSLRQAVLNAASGDTITFALSPACSTITLTSGEIDISQSLTIDGPGAGALAVSGNDQSRVFAVISGTVAISGLTIENGDIPGNINSSGGGINNDGTLSVTNTVLLDNTVQGPGGGIYNDFGASLTVTDSTFLGDGGPIASGGAISNEGTAVTISGSSLVDNTADQGGGIWSQGPTITITNSSISDNTGGGISASGTLSLTDSTVSGNSGGGGVRDGGELTVTDSQVSDNSGTGISGDPLVLTGSTVSGNSGATDGGGIYARGTSSVTTSTISDNSASDGGGIYFDQGTLSVTNSTISGNFTALSHGGGDIADYSPGLSMAATIVASSPSGGDCSMPGYVTITDGGDNLDDDGSCGFTAGTDHPDTPAGLDPTGPESNGGPTQTVALEPGSAAIGAVHGASLCSMPDQRGVARSTPCDIGAFQSHFLVVTNCNNTGSGSLRQAASTAVFGDSISFALAPACSLITVGSPIDITATVGIDGPGAGVLAVSGSNAVGAFAVSSGVSATVSGLTIEDGKGVLPDGGGGILNSGTLTVENSALSGNTSSADGGGISNLGTLTVVDDTLTGNSTGTASGLDDTNGGGALFNDGLLTVVGSTLSNNAGAGGGGGIANDGGQVSVTGSTLSGNKSPGIAGASGSGRGGGIWTNGGTLGVADSTLSGNSASLDGGGVYDVGNGLASVSDTTVSGNSATHDGGGVMNGGSLWVIADSTLSGNSAVAGGGIDNNGLMALTTSTLSGDTAGTGGGIDNTGDLAVTMSTVSGNGATSSGGGVDNGSLASLAGTIVADNTPGGDCTGTITDAGYNLDDASSCGFSSVNHSQSGANPELGPLQNNGGPTATEVPAYNSPVFGQIPYGTTADGVKLCPGTDQRGISRPQGGACDVGAVEVPLGTQTITFTSTAPTSVVEGGPSYTASATGGGSGNPVMFSTADSGSNPCTVTGSTYSFVGPGQCEVIANQAGNASYQQAPPAFQLINVTAPPPTIAKVRPMKAKVGRKVTIVGTYLLGTTQVSFNGTPATVLSNTQTSITTKVPKGATTGTIKVTTPGGTVASAKVFTVK